MMIQNQKKQKQKQVITSGAPLISSIFLVVFIVVSLWLIFEYADKERNRDLLNWQSRLALLAEIRAAGIEDWISSRKAQLNELANNPSLKLFLSQYANKEEIDSSVLNAQRGHVRNLLRASAERFGFSKKTTGYDALNTNEESDFGLAIIGADQLLVMSTKGFPGDAETYKSVIKDVFATARAKIIDLHANSKQQAVYGYLIPVFQIQDIQAKKPVGAVMVLLNPQQTLFNILQNRQSATKTDETLLVKQSGPSLVYISPLQGSYSIFHTLPDNNNQLAASYAYHNPGGFAEMRDYRGEQVLVTGRKINNSPWRLVQKISANEALAESNKHQRFLLTTFSLFVLFVSTAFVAIWRHSTSMRLQQLSDTLETRTELLDAVTDNIQEKIILLEEDSKIAFINPVFADALQLDVEEVMSKHLASILGSKTAKQLEAIDSSQQDAQVMLLSINNSERTYHVTSTTLMSGDHKNARLFVLHDISEIKQEQAKREQLGRGIISTLVKAVDLHDPFCANHSERTREVAVEIGKAMNLTAERLETLEMAALLANIGKLFVPKDILTKMDALTEDESKQLRSNIDYAVDILADLSFNGPVIDIISQKNERMDGSGYPRGLSGDQILLESSILAVANAFVAMASSRAYREGRAVKDVVDLLLQQTDSNYDRHVVAALFHIAENQADWDTWQNVSHP